MLRYVGDVEKLSSMRHFYGYYKCVAVTAGYATEVDARNIPSLIESAITKVILRHPSLCVGIVGEDQEKPAFVRLDSIDLSKCIEYRDVIAFTPDEYNAALESILERQHSQTWPDLYCRPAWKVIVVQSRATPSNNITFDIVFAYHHALSDGSSGLIFHRTFLEALNADTMVENVDRYVKIPEELALPAPIEEQVKFTTSLPFTIQEFWKVWKPGWLKCPGKTAAWTGSSSLLKLIQNYKSRVKIISIDACQLELILVACHNQETTLTGLLHGIIVQSFTSHVTEARGFVGETAYSLRHLLPESSRREIGCYAWGYRSQYTAGIVSNIRSSMTGAQPTDQIWDLARVYSKSISTELSRLPHNIEIGLLPYAKNLHKIYQSQIGKPRDATFEISNIGAFKNASEEDMWKIDKIVFSQSGMAIGLAVNFDVVSTVGGPLSISATWLEGVVEDKLVNSICGDIDQILNNWDKTNMAEAEIQHLGGGNVG